MVPKRIYLDNQDFTNCVEPRVAGWTEAGLADLRAAIQAAQARRDIVMLGSLSHLEEMSRIHPVARKIIVDFFWDVVNTNVLKPTDELVKDEVRRRRALKDNEPFLPLAEQQEANRISRTDTEANSLATTIAKNSKASKSVMQKNKAQLLQEFAKKEPGKSLAAETKKWFQNLDSVLADWSDDYMTSSKEHLGLPDDKSQWPDPVTLPTIKAVIVSNLARIYLQNAEGEKIKGSDTHDTHHYAAASYADVLVTEDKAFRTLLDKVPSKTVQVISFNEFAASLGVTPH